MRKVQARAEGNLAELKKHLNMQAKRFVGKKKTTQNQPTKGSVWNSKSFGVRGKGFIVNLKEITRNHQKSTEATISVEINGNRRKSTEISRNQWKATESNGKQRKSSEINGYQQAESNGKQITRRRPSEAPSWYADARESADHERS